MKKSDFKKCGICGDGMMHNGLPLFWKLEVSRHGIKMDAVRRQHGMEIMLGSAALASVMGPDDDLTMQLAEPVTILICETCIDQTRLAQAAEIEWEKLNERKKSEETA